MENTSIIKEVTVPILGYSVCFYFQPAELHAVCVLSVNIKKNQQQFSVSEKIAAQLLDIITRY